MEQVTNRTSFTSRGYLAFSPYTVWSSLYEVGNINLGTNPLSLLEIVSALNSFNLGPWQYQFNYLNCAEKYNPKVYLGAVQSTTYGWNKDAQGGPGSGQKSGSWIKNITALHIFSTKNDRAIAKF